MRTYFAILVACVMSAQLAESAAGQQLYLPPQELPGVDSEAGVEQDVVFDQEATLRKSNPLLWQQYQALQTASPELPGPGGAGCGCGGGGLLYNRCGCNPFVFPWIGGPGRCDSWCVGPKWQVAADGMIMSRDDADWAAIIADVGTAPDLVEQLDYSLGGRLFVTGYNWNDFGLQIGYEGMNDFEGTAVFPQASAVQTFDYDSRLNSVEFNFLPKVPYPVKFFAGFRYIEIDEDFGEFTSNDKPIPPPSDPPAPNVAVIDTGTSLLIDNRLVGFQLGGLRDSWQFGRWISFEGFANAGVYCNMYKRVNISRNVTTVITGDDLSTPENEFSETVTEVDTVTRQDFDEISFAAEAGISAVTRLTQCVALRGGYQVLMVDGVGQGMDAYFAPDLVSSTILYHGLQFGLEYRR